MSTPITKHFTWEELACHDGTPVPAEYRPNTILIAARADVFREFLGFPLRVISGYRTPAWNAKVGGEDHSFHMSGSAMDLEDPSGLFKGPHLHAVYTGLIRSGLVPDGGVGLYDTFIHIDIGPGGPARHFDRRKHK